MEDRFRLDFEGILPKGPYLPWVSMVGRALLAGYHRFVLTLNLITHQSFNSLTYFFISKCSRSGQFLCASVWSVEAYSRLAINNNSEKLSCLTLQSLTCLLIKIVFGVRRAADTVVTKFLEPVDICHQHHSEINKCLFCSIWSICQDLASDVRICDLYTADIRRGHRMA